MKKLLSIFLVLCMTSPAFGVGVELNEERLDLNGYLKLNKFQTPYAQTLVVAVSGADYTTITAALAAITDNATGKRYCINVKPGTYVENVVGKDYVDIIGESWESCIIAPATGIAINDSGVDYAVRKGLSFIGVTNNNTIRLTTHTELTYQDCFIKGGGTASDTINFNSGASLTDVRFENVIIDTFGNTNGIVTNSTPTSTTRFILDHVYMYSSGAAGATGVYFYADGAAEATSSLIAQDCSIIGFTSALKAEVGSNSKFSTIYAYNNYCPTSTFTLRANATRTATIYSYGDTISAVTKIGGGGTESFNSMGSVVGGGRCDSPASNMIGVIAGTGISGVTGSTVRVVGSTGAVDISANPQIVDGQDGQFITFVGLSDTNTVKFDDAADLAIGANITLGVDDTLTVQYDATADRWRKICNADN